MVASRRIFLAHAREDKELVRQLYRDLKAHGFDPWLDEYDLIPGQIWKDEIPKAIKRASVFLACLSGHSVDKVGYVQSEFRSALTAFGVRPAGSIYLVPVRLNICEVPDLKIADLGLGLKDFHWVDLWKEGGFERLVWAINRALAGNCAPSVVAKRLQDQPFSDLPKASTPTLQIVKQEAAYKRPVSNSMIAATLIGASATVLVGALMSPWVRLDPDCPGCI